VAPAQKKKKSVSKSKSPEAAKDAKEPEAKLTKAGLAKKREKEKSKPKSPPKPVNRKAKKQEPEPEPEVKPTSRSRRAASRSAKVEESERSASVKSEKKKKKAPKAKKTAVKNTGLTKAQMAEYKTLLNDYLEKTADQLKDILAKNGQSRTGNKGELAAKCADGKLLGRIPTCASCGGGKLRFNQSNGMYSCPGYMDDDDFVRCSKTYLMSEIVRDPWTES
jgi:hypothetical protein